MRNHISVTPKVFVRNGADKATKYAAEVRRKERKPREETDLPEVHVPLGRQVERDPEAEGLPFRFGKEARNRDRPEAPRRKKFLHRRFWGSSVRGVCPDRTCSRSPGDSKAGSLSGR